MELGGLGLAEKRNPDYTWCPGWDFTWKETPNLNTKQRVKKSTFLPVTVSKKYIYFFIIC